MSSDISNNTMNTLIFLAESFFPSGWQGILLQFAIGVVVVWAIYALYKWSELKAPRPVEIVFIALACIFAIIWLFKIFNTLT